MAFGVKVKVEGAAELKKALEQLAPKLQRKVLRKALRAGARPILKRTKATAPVDQGLLKRALTIRALKTRKRGLVGVKITTGRKAPHAHLVELGTAERRTKSGKYTGSVKPMNFMGKAANEEFSNAVAIVSSVLATEIPKEMKRGS